MVDGPLGSFSSLSLESDPLSVVVEPAFLIRKHSSFPSCSNQINIALHSTVGVSSPDCIAVLLHVHLGHNHRHVQRVPIEPPVLVTGVEVV